MFQELLPRVTKADMKETRGLCQLMRWPSFWVIWIVEMSSRCLCWRSQFWYPNFSCKQHKVVETSHATSADEHVEHSGLPNCGLEWLDYSEADYELVLSLYPRYSKKRSLQGLNADAYALSLALSGAFISGMWALKSPSSIILIVCFLNFNSSSCCRSIDLWS